MTRIPTTENIAERLVDVQAAVPNLTLLVLFGSMARARARVGSDVDLGVQCDGEVNLDVLHVAIASRLGTDLIDLVEIRRVAPLLAFQIARTGRLIFERSPGMFRQFQSLAARRYADAEKYRRLQHLALRTALKRGGLR